ncbi:MAG: RluA family pseudouridine synthase [Christensenellales bacterium]|jgi:23S rRNA pseudouridine1911/1915/1917 synthase
MENYIKIQVENCGENNTIYRYLKSLSYSENYLKNLRKSPSNIKLNGKEVFIIVSIKNGDIIELNPNPKTKTCIMQIDKPLDVVFEDDYVLVVNKPSGISCMPNRSHYDNNLAGMIVAHMANKNPNFVLRMINRLDKDTQGLIMISKDAVNYKFLFENHQKVYHAIVEGSLTNQVVIDSPILDEKDEKGIIKIKRVIHQNGKPAKTILTPLKQLGDKTLVEAKIYQGRTHQIRVHSASICHPLVGDYIYGTESKLINHTALVCKTLCFTHPILKQTLCFSVDYEEDFKSLITNFSNHNEN